jgi:hypothetical protein
MCCVSGCAASVGKIYRVNLPVGKTHLKEHEKLSYVIMPPERHESNTTTERSNGNNQRDNRRSRGWCFTWNNYPAEYRSQLDSLDCRYVCAGEEVAPSTGTPHLQGYVYFRNAKRLSTLRRELPACHLAIAAGNPAQNRLYCGKLRPEDAEPNAVFYERGDIPLSPTEQGDMERARYERAWSLAKAGDIETIDADIRVRLYSGLRRIERDYMPSVERLASPCGLWIFGRSGSGKTKSVLDAFPECYPKPRNDWWDGYQREPVVLLDDVDKFDVRLGGKLKHWADAAPFIGEIKGGSTKIRPTKFIVTSQYKIEDIWEDAETREALNRRFTTVEKILGQDIILV